MLYLQIFLSFFKIGVFALGGAYSFLPLIERECVINHSWLTKAEFLDISGVVTIFPGAISIKYATYIGYKTAGIGGAVIANAANLLAPVALVIVASYFYLKHRDVPQVKGAFHMIQLVVFAMIIAVAFQMVDIGRLLDMKSIVIVVISFILFLFSKIDPALIIIGAGVLGIFMR